MNGDGMLDALGHIDPELIREADRRPGWGRWVVVAACVAVLVGASLLWLRPKDAPTVPLPSADPGQDLVPLLDYTVSTEKVSGGPGLGSSSSVRAQEPPDFFFDLAMAVEARVLGVLQETFQDLDTGRTYRVMKLEILDVVSGKDVPRELYLRLDSHMSPELDRFDSLILSIEQVGLENYLMLREDGYYVVFPMMFQANHHYAPYYGPVLAFTDGVLDLALWEMDRWQIGREHLKRELGGSYIADEGDTVETVKETIRQKIRDESAFREQCVYGRSAYTSEEAQKVLERVRSFEDGAFSHSLEWGDPGTVPTVTFIRRIDGFDTSERILIDGSGVTYQGESFTAEDWAHVPDLAAAIDKLETQELAPPHIDDPEGLDPFVSRYGIEGKYFKVSGQVYSVVKSSWTYYVSGPGNSSFVYYDAAFYLVDLDGSWRAVEREELRQLVGTDDLLGGEEYGVPVARPLR